MSEGNAKPRVFLTRAIVNTAMQALDRETRLDVWRQELPPPKAVLTEAATRSHGLLTLLTDSIDSDVLTGSDKLLVVSNMATGFDNVDVKTASQNRILVTRTPGVLTKTTADFAFALLLAAARRITEADRHVRSGRWRTWEPQALLGRDVFGGTLGIVGLGQIGLAVAKRARGFGMRVLYYSRSRKPALEKRWRLTWVGLDELLEQADFVSLHAPLTPETQHLIGKRELDLMRPEAILINTTRGGLLDQRALYEALRDKRIAGAALDVTEVEPISGNDQLLRLENVIITPHIGSASVETRTRMALLAVDNLLTALRGYMPRQTVNPEIAQPWRKAYKARIALP